MANRPRGSSRECLGFYHVYGDNPVVRMNYFSDRAIVDLRPFFKDVFEARDRMLGRPKYDRTEQINSNIVQYRFTIVELAESMLAAHTPRELVGFLRRHTAKDEIPAEAFLRKMENFDSRYREATVSKAPGDGDFLNVNYYFRAMNFSAEELRHLLLEIVPSGAMSESRKKHAFASFRGRIFKENDGKNSAGLPVKAHDDEWFRQHRLIKRIRDALLDQKPPIVLLNDGGPDSLDDVSLLRAYHEIDATGLEVVKRKE